MTNTHHTFATPGPVQLRLNLPAGRVTVEAVETGTTTVELVPLGRDHDAARNLIERTRVEAFDDVVVVEVPGGLWLRRVPEIGCTVRLPEGSGVEIKVATADVRATGWLAAADVSTATGDVDIEQVDGDASAKTATGDVRLRHVGGAVQAKAASGNVRVDSVGGELCANSASGDITVREAVQSVLAKTVSGEVAVGVAYRGTVEVRTVSGDVAVGVAPGVTAWLDCSAVSGRVRSELGVEDRRPVGDGDTLTMTVRSVSGDITVRRGVAVGV